MLSGTKIRIFSNNTAHFSENFYIPLVNGQTHVRKINIFYLIFSHIFFPEWDFILYFCVSRFLSVWGQAIATCRGTCGNTHVDSQGNTHRDSQGMRP